MSIEFCAPDYYLWTLKNWLSYIEPTLAEFGLRVEAFTLRSVCMHTCGCVYRGIPDNEGALLELVLGTCLKKWKRRAAMNKWAVLFAAVAIHMIGFGSVIPSIPYLVKEVGGGAVLQGVLVSTFALMQFLTAPLWGYLSDRLGRAVVASAGLLLAAFGQLVAYTAHSATTLLLGRAVSGVGGGTLPALQSLMAELAPAERRASSMALFGAAFGVGFVVGPALGGALSIISPRLPFLIAAALSAAAAAAVTRLPNIKHVGEPRVEWKIGLLALPVLLLNAGFSMFEGLVAYFAAFAAGLTPAQIGLMLAAAGVAAGAAQPAVRRLEASVSAAVGVFTGLLITAAGLASLYFYSYGPAVVYLGVAAASLGQVVASSFIFSMASKTGGPLGLSFGALQSSGSLGRIIGPALGGYLYQHAGPAAPFAAALAFVAATAAFILPASARR
ncbi:MAG: MFS transporter [Pyrobaculum sp.]